MNWNKTKLVSTAAAILTGAAAFHLIPGWYFAESKPALAKDHESINGKPAAWGRRPRLAGLFQEWLQPPYSGKEWVLVYHREYCREWTRRHGYGFPEDQ
jgi:hypothetical protein